MTSQESGQQAGAPQAAKGTMPVGEGVESSLEFFTDRKSVV